MPSLSSPVRRIAVMPAPLWLLAGCSTTQSALHPAADDAEILAQLSWVLFIGAGVIFAGVLVLMGLALRGRSGRWLGSRRAVVAGGVAFPVVVLSLLLAYGIVVLRVTNADGDGEPLRVTMVGEQYWFRVDYAGEAGAPGFTTANELVVPVGRPVAVDVTAADVIHSFWVPSFAGKIDMIPGRLNTIRFTPEKAGVFRGVCTEYCGEQHALMAFDVVALAPDNFAAWRAAQARDARSPDSELLALGWQVFERGNCGTCHAVRGTPADGRIGPDLTHVGSRRTIGAGSFPNNAGTLGGWIADTQALKPGARMPSYSSLSGEELRAVSTYLESLK